MLVKYQTVFSGTILLFAVHLSVNDFTTTLSLNVRVPTKVPLATENSFE